MLRQRQTPFGFTHVIFPGLDKLHTLVSAILPRRTVLAKLGELHDLLALVPVPAQSWLQFRQR